MRTLKECRTALERQAWESVMIDRLTKNPEQCLNLKNEWGLSKKPALETKARYKEAKKGEERPGAEVANNKTKRGKYRVEGDSIRGQEESERPTHCSGVYVSHVKLIFF